MIIPLVPLPCNGPAQSVTDSALNPDRRLDFDLFVPTCRTSSSLEAESAIED